MKSLYIACIAAITCLGLARHAQAATWNVGVQDYSFSNNNLNVQVGDVIHFYWISGTHTSTSTSVPAGAATWNAPMSSTNQTYDYTVTVAGTYNYHCIYHTTMTGTFTATAVSNLSVTLNVSNTAACNNLCPAVITTTVSGGTSPYSFIWSNGATGNPLTNICAGTYSLTVIDANGASDVASTTVVITPGVSITSTVSGATCELSNGGISTSETGGQGPYTFIWSNGSTDQNLTNIQTGIYTLSVTDANGCSAVHTDTVTSTFNPTLQGAVTNTTCGASNGAIDITVFGGFPPFSITWSNGDTVQDINNLASGSYVISLTDNYGCHSVDTFTVAPSTPSNLVACFTSDNPCGCSAPIVVTFQSCSTPSSGLTYAWSFNGALPNTSAQPSPSATYTTSGSFDVSLTVTDTSGCTATQSIPNYVNIGTVTVLFTYNGNLIANSPVQFLTAPASGHHWTVTPNTAVISNDTAQNPIITFTQPNTYQVCLTDTFTGLCGCLVAEPVCSTLVVLPSAVNNVKANSAVTAFPNPAFGAVTLQASQPFNLTMEARLLDATGRAVLRQSLPASASAVTLDVHELPAGLYVYELAEPSKRVVARGKLAVSR